MMVFLNGRLVSEKRAVVPVTDRGFLYGDGVYETIRVYGGRPFLLRDHLRRLNDSMAGVKLAPPMSLMEIGHAVQKVIAANKMSEAVVRVTITRGSGPRGFDTTGCGKPTVAITATTFPGYPADQYREGIVAAVVSVRRTNPKSVPSHIKSNNCLNQILARMEATQLGAKEAILLAGAGNVTEGSASNVFIVKNGLIVTPKVDGNLLPGITRDWVIRIAREAGHQVDEKRMPVSALMSADEVFLTNSTMEIMPVSRLIFNHGRRPQTMRLGPYMKTSGFVGPVTIGLMVRYRDAVRSIQRV